MDLNRANDTRRKSRSASANGLTWTGHRRDSGPPSACGDVGDGERDRILYRRGSVRWSREAPGRGLWGRTMNRIMRQAAGVEGLMDRYTGPGEVAIVGESGGRLLAFDPPAQALVADQRTLVRLQLTWASTSRSRRRCAEGPSGPTWSSCV